MDKTKALEGHYIIRIRLKKCDFMYVIHLIDNDNDYNYNKTLMLFNKNQLNIVDIYVIIPKMFNKFKLTFKRLHIKLFLSEIYIYEFLS